MAEDGFYEVDEADYNDSKDSGNIISDYLGSVPSSALQKKYGSYFDAYRSAKSLTPYLPYGSAVHAGLSVAEAGANWWLTE